MQVHLSPSIIVVHRFFALLFKPWPSLEMETRKSFCTIPKGRYCVENNLLFFDTRSFVTGSLPPEAAQNLPIDVPRKQITARETQEVVAVSV